MLERPQRIHITNDTDSVQLQELGMVDAQELFDLIDYDRLHLDEYGPIFIGAIETPGDVSLYLAQQDGLKNRFGIWDQGKLRGEIDFMPRAGGEAEVGYWVGKEHTGHGYASRAQRLLTEWAFNRFTYFETLYTQVHSGNIASQRTSINAGFKFERETEDWLRFVRHRDS